MMNDEFRIMKCKKRRDTSWTGNGRPKKSAGRSVLWRGKLFNLT